MVHHVIDIIIIPLDGTSQSSQRCFHYLLKPCVQIPGNFHCWTTKNIVIESSHCTGCFFCGSIWIYLIWSLSASSPINDVEHTPQHSVRFRTFAESCTSNFGWNMLKPEKPWKTHQLQDFAGPSTHIHTTMFFLQAARNVRRTTTLCWDASCSWANAREIRDFPGILRLNFKHFSYWI